MSITFNGLGSGLDIDSIVTAIVDAERAPAENRLNRLEEDTTEELSAIGQLSSALTSFLDAADALGEEDLYNGRTVSIGDRDLLAASADETAQTGSFQIQIEQIATANKIATQAIADAETEVGTGTLTITLDGASFDVEVGSENNTITQIRDAINESDANIGVTASVITDDTGTRLVLTSDETGAANTIAVTVADDDGDSRDLAGLSQLVYDPTDINALGDGGVVHDGQELTAAQDATLYIDGLRVTSASNSVTNAIDGVTLDLLDAQADEDFTDGDTINLTIVNDEDSIKGAINNFIDVYNGFIGVVDQLTLVVVNDGTTGNLTGALTGDSTVRNLVSNIRSSLSEGIDSNPDGLQFLVNLGLTTDEDGLLTLDESALDEALDNDIQAVANLFTGEAGLSERLSEALSGYNGSGGVLELRQDSLRETINDIDDQREALEARLDLTEARLFAQYQAADALIGQLNNTLGFITSALSSIDFNNDDN